jgi:aerobic carbon-monoxide dehydrogenase medium subunit
MKGFEFHRPLSISEAVTLLQGKEAAKLLAGGQSLLPVMKLDLAQPSDLVSLAAIKALREIRDGDPLVIGALATHDEVATSPVVRRAIPALAALAGGIGDAQVRNRGTIGGSVAHGDPAADYPAAVLALGATIETDRRQISADDYFTGLFTTELAPDEIVTAVHFPVPEKAAYAKFASPASKYAIVGVFVAKTAGGVRVAVTGAGTHAFRVPALESALAANFSPGAVTPGSVSPGDLRSDIEASAEYRAHLITVMARRAVEAAK